jgi:transposase InsO family protein
MRRISLARADDDLREMGNQLWVSDFTYVATWRGPWRHLEAVTFATSEWVDWFDTRRLLEPIDYVSPAEYEARRYEQAAAAGQLSASG